MTQWCPECRNSARGRARFRIACWRCNNAVTVVAPLEGERVSDYMLRAREASSSDYPKE